jgi:hypothetical protein
MQKTGPEFDKFEEGNDSIHNESPHKGLIEIKKAG